MILNIIPSLNSSFLVIFDIFSFRLIQITFCVNLISFANYLFAGSLSKLNKIDFRYNSLTGPIPSSIGKLFILLSLFIRRYMHYFINSQIFQASVVASCSSTFISIFLLCLSYCINDQTSVFRQ